MVFIKKLVFFITKTALVFLVLFLLLFWFLTVPGQVEPPVLQSKDVATSQQVLASSARKLQNPNIDIEIVLKQTDLDAITRVASHTFSPFTFSAALFDAGAVIHVVYALPSLLKNRLLHFYCYFSETSTGFKITSCNIGRLTIPAVIANFLFESSIKLLLATPADQQIIQLVNSAKAHAEQINFKSDQQAIALSINQNTFNLNSPVQALFGGDREQAPNIAFYLTELENLVAANPHERRLAFYMRALLQAALVQAEHNDPSAEYKSALWALAVAFGNKRFAPYAKTGLKAEEIANFPRLKLANRADLSLHFLYSAVFKMLGNAYFADQIGYLKEINDAGAGGSGFSFVDMAANKAGVYFVQNLSNINQARVLDLSIAEFEQAFFPAIDNLPEHLAELTMQQDFGGFTGERVIQLESLIEQRLVELILFK